MIAPTTDKCISIIKGMDFETPRGKIAMSGCAAPRLQLREILMSIELNRRSAALALITFMSISAAAEPLPRNIVDRTQVSVSGLSSGGFMAVQMHVAYSATFAKGAGVVAGGPYDCAEGALSNALGRCMTTSGSIPVGHLAALTRTRATGGQIDAVSNLATSKAYLFAGTVDTTVNPRATHELMTYYADFMPATSILMKTDIVAEHAMITDDFGSACAAKGPPFINDCDFDLAGGLLAHLHGPLAPRNNGPLGGRFIEFDQGRYGSGHGLGAKGWAYVPAACDGSAPCALHVALHGCRQNSGDIGDQYVRRTGYNRWADSNRIVVLYPQTGPGATNSCWDWWGYDSADYALKAGPQMKAIKAMVDDLAGVGAPDIEPCFTATNSDHYTADRATMFFGATYAKGSGQSMGWWFQTSSLQQTAPGQYRVGSCG